MLQMSPPGTIYQMHFIFAFEHAFHPCSIFFFCTITLLRVGNSLKRADTSLLRNTLKLFFYNGNHFIRFAENSIPI